MNAAESGAKAAAGEMKKMASTGPPRERGGEVISLVMGALAAAVLQRGRRVNAAESVAS